MKLSDMIFELETILDQHGDLEVRVPSHENGATDKVTDLDVDDADKTLYILP